MVVRGAEPREVRAGMTRLTTVGRKGMKRLQNISRQNRKFSKVGNEGKKAGEQRGQERCRDKHSLQICLTKQKTQEGNSNSSQSYRGSKSSRECMDDKRQQSLTPQCFLHVKPLNAEASTGKHICGGSYRHLKQ